MAGRIACVRGELKAALDKKYKEKDWSFIVSAGGKMLSLSRPSGEITSQGRVVSSGVLSRVPGCTCTEEVECMP